MSACKWIDGENVVPATVKEARALIGKTVEYVRKGRTDSYRGWACREIGEVTDVLGRQMEVGGDYLSFSTILEMAIREPRA